MAISRVGAATGATSCTVPTHNIGDLIVISAFRDGSTTAPSLPAGYTSISTNTATSASARLGYKIATATNDASGTWTNATGITCVVYTSTQIAAGGFIFVGGEGLSSGTTNTLTYNTVSMLHTDGSSWVAGFIGHRSTDEALSTHVPSGMTFITNSDLINTAEVCAYDTNATVSSWTSTNVTVTGTASGWTSQTLEILESVPSTGLGSGHLIQSMAFSVSNTAQVTDPGNNFVFPFPNTTLANNAILAVINYPVGSTISSITDDSGSNTWSTTPVKTITGGSQIQAAFLLTSAAALNFVRFNFTANIQPIKCWLREYFNVTGFDSGTTNSNAGTTSSPAIISCGAFTPSANNCIVDAFYGLDAAFGGSPSQFIKDAGFTLNDCDIAGTSGQTWAAASQVTKQGTAASITPKMGVVHTGTSDTYLGVAVALTTGSQGTALPAGIHVDRMHHLVNEVGVTTWTVDIPSTGNLGCFGLWGNLGNPVTCTDSDGVAWTLKANGNNALAQFFYRENYTPNDIRTVTLSLSNGAGNPMALYWLDVSGAATSSFDVMTNQATALFSSASPPTTLTAQPSITPTTANGLIFAFTTNGIGPTPSVASSVDTARYLLPLNTSQGDGGMYALGNGVAIIYNASTAAHSLSWTNAYGNISSGTYNSGTGALVLTATFPGSPDTNQPWAQLGNTNNIALANLTGTGALSSLQPPNGPWTTNAGLAANTVSATATAGLGAITITGGVVYPDGSGSTPAAIAFKAPSTTVTGVPWFTKFEDPVRFKSGILAAQQQFLAKNTFTPAPPPVIFGWFNNFSDPVRIRPGIRPEQQQFLAQSLNPRVSFSWFDWLSDPVRTPLRLNTGAQHVFSTDTNPKVSFSWFNRLNEPVKVPAAIRAGQQQFTALFPSPLVPFSWFNPLRNPVRIPPRVLGPQFFATDTNTPTTATPTFGWFNWLGEPVRSRPGLQTGAQQFLAQSLNPLVPFSWLENLVDPIRTRVSLPTGQQQFLAQSLNPLVSFSWFDNFTDPVRAKSGLLAAQQQFISLQPAPSPFVASGWFEPLSEPVRQKLGLGSGSQQYLAFYPFPFPTVTVSFGWFEALSNPSKLDKAGLSAALQQVLALNPQPIVPFGWHEPLTLPTPPKRGLGAWLQQAFTKSTFTPAAVTPISYWFYGLSQPVRGLPGLGTWLQQFYTGPPRLIQVVKVTTGILNATETRDVFHSLGSIFGRPITGQVGIIEKPYNPMSGIVEVPLSAGVGGVIESGTSPRSGIFLPAVASAVVSIREV